MDQQQDGENGLSWRDAIIEVLKTAQKPMRAAEIVAAIKEHKLRKVTGDTPEETVGACMYSSMKRYGENSPFEQPEPSHFAYRKPTESASSVSAQLGGAVLEDDDEEPKKSAGIIRAFGMYWRRDGVIWKTLLRGS